MVAAIFIWFYIFILVYLYGMAAISGLSRFLHVDQDEAINLPLLLLMGLVTLTVIAMIANLFIPLGAMFIILLSLGALFIVFQRRLFLPVAFPKYQPLTWLLLIAVFLTVLENSTHAPLNSDTGLYHAQTIRWFEEYRIVPGLGNLHERLAFNSSWLVLNASLSFAFLGLRSFHLVGGILFLSSAFYFAEGLEAFFQGKLSLSIILKILFLPLSFYLLGSELASPGTDMPVSLLAWIILTVWIERLESQSPTELQAVLLFIFCLFSVTLKLAAVPLLLLALWIGVEFFMAKDWRGVFLLGIVGAIILLPWMIRSIFLSGYLVFPISQIDLFSVDWKMPAEQVDITRQSITGYARVLRNDWTYILGLTFKEWMSIWLAKQTLNRKIIYVLVLVSPLLIGVGRSRYPSVITKKHILVYCIFMLGSIFWFVSAPIIRFGYGFLIGICVLSLAPFLLTILTKMNQGFQPTPIVILLLVTLFQLYTLVWSFDASTFSRRLLLPADYFPSKASLCGIANGQMYCQNELSQCHYDAFPCIPKPRPLVEMRGQSFQDGFRTIP